MSSVNQVEVTETTESQTEVEASTNPLSAFGVDAGLLGFQAFNFILVFLVVWFLILKPLTSKLKERQEMIDKSIKNSEKIEKKLRQGESAFQEKVDMAKVEANRVIEKARHEADNLSADIKEKTKRDIEELVKNARTNIQTERDNMIKEIKEHTTDLIIGALQKILPQKLDAKKDKEIIKKALDEIKYEKK